jgi:hypothetical protein
MRLRNGRITAAILLALGTVTLPFSASVTSHASAAPPATTSPFTNIPGVPWADAGGNLIQGHNGSIVQVGSTYYWIGDDMANGARDGATCYSSTDLVHWTRINGDANAQGDILSVNNGLANPAWWPASLSSPQYLMGTTKVIQVSSNEFVMWASVGIKAPNGPYPKAAPYFLL